VLYCDVFDSVAIYHGCNGGHNSTILTESEQGLSTAFTLSLAAVTQWRCVVLRWCLWYQRSDANLSWYHERLVLTVLNFRHN